MRWSIARQTGLMQHLRYWQLASRQPCHRVHPSRVLSSVALIEFRRHTAARCYMTPGRAAACNPRWPRRKHFFFLSKSSQSLQDEQLCHLGHPAINLVSLGAKIIEGQNEKGREGGELRRQRLALQAAPAYSLNTSNTGQPSSRPAAPVHIKIVFSALSPHRLFFSHSFC
jgi:hypothetical protein